MNLESRMRNGTLTQQDKRLLSRRTFLVTGSKAAAGVTLGGALGAYGCGEKNPIGPTTPQPPTNEPFDVSFFVYNSSRTGTIAEFKRTVRQGEVISLPFASLGVSGVDSNFMYATDTAADYTKAVALAKTANGNLSMTADKNHKSIDLITYDISNGEDYMTFHNVAEGDKPGAGRTLVGNKREWSVRPFNQGEIPYSDMVMQDGPMNIWFGVSSDGVPAVVDQLDDALASGCKRFGRLIPVGNDTPADIRVGFGYLPSLSAGGLHGGNWATVQYHAERTHRGMRGTGLGEMPEVFTMVQNAAKVAGTLLYTENTGSLTPKGKNYIRFAVGYPI